jgi:hypothetical protein
MTKKILFVALYGYGFQRQWNSTYQPNLISHKIVLSTLNGLFYVCPPFCMVKIFNIVKRLRHDHNPCPYHPTHYPPYYDEIFFTNKHIL